MLPGAAPRRDASALRAVIQLLQPCPVRAWRYWSVVIPMNRFAACGGVPEASITPGMVERWLGGGDARASDADYAGDPGRSHGGDRHGPSRPADPRQAAPAGVDVVSRPRILDCRDLSIARRASDPSLAALQDRHGATDQESGPGQHRDAAGGSRAVDEEDRGMHADG